MVERIRFSVFMFLVFALPGMPALLAKRHKLPPKQLLERARKLTDFRSKGSEPFHLTADFKLFTMASNQQEGTYTLLWLSPEKWREEIALPDFTQVRILVGNRMWRQRSSPVVHSLVYKLQHVLDFQPWLAPTRGEKFSRVKSRKLNEVAAHCFKVRHRAGGNAELCFDPASGVLLSVGNKANGTFFSHYEQWGSKLIPHSVTNFQNHVADVEFTVTQVSSPGRPRPGAFTPPPGAVEMPGCQYPTPPRMLNKLRPREPSAADPRNLIGTVRMLGEVGVDGKMHHVHVIGSPHEEPGGPVLRAVSRMKFKPASCKGTPVPFDLEIDYDFGD